MSEDATPARDHDVRSAYVIPDKKSDGMAYAYCSRCDRPIEWSDAAGRMVHKHIMSHPRMSDPAPMPGPWRIEEIDVSTLFNPKTWYFVMRDHCAWADECKCAMFDTREEAETYLAAMKAEESS